MAEGKIYVAAQDGLCVLEDGRVITLKAGVTRVREGHPLLKGREVMFRELDVHYDLEDARSAPEEKKAEPVPDPPEEKAKEPEKKTAGLTSEDAPQPQPRGRRRVMKTD